MSFEFDEMKEISFADVISAPEFSIEINPCDWIIVDPPMKRIAVNFWVDVIPPFFENFLFVLKFKI